VELVRVRLKAARNVLSALRDFYGDRLGLSSSGEAQFDIGQSQIEFVPTEGAPFYHVALLVPGDRFDVALEWARERVKLIPTRTGELVFDFSFWNALACYFEDPAGSIIELIAHRGIGESRTSGAFTPAELLGLSEVGLVGDVPAMARQLESLALALWDGSADDPESLAFVGEKARTLILCPLGRGWLPIQRRAEAHPVYVELVGPRTARARVGVHEIVSSA